jgi:hypothetical protein
MTKQPTVSSDSVAQDQLRAFVERLETPYGRVEYVIDRVRRCRGVSERTMSRAYRLAGEVLNMPYHRAQLFCVLGMIGGDLDYSAVGPLRGDVVGYVYLARRASEPGVVKVGFSTDPERRERELSIGGPGLRIFRTYVGTMLDEHVVHCDRRHLRVEGEWFRAREAA